MFVREEVERAITAAAEETKSLVELAVGSDPNTGDFIIRARSAALLCRSFAVLLEETADLSDRE